MVSDKETAQTHQVFSFLVSICVLVAKGKVQRASLSPGERTHRLDMFPFVFCSVFQL